MLYDPATGAVTLPGGSGSVGFSTPFPGLRAPQDVAHDSAHVVDVFAKAGVNLTSAAPNPARGATTSASYTAPGTTTAAAVDGLPTNEPLWGTAGSPNDTDWYELDLGRARSVAEVRPHFRDDRAANRYRAPASYAVQHWNGSAWATVPAQTRTPATARANYNRVRFAPVTTQRLRVRLTHAPGFKTALTEIKAY